MALEIVAEVKQTCSFTAIDKLFQLWDNWFAKVTTEIRREDAKIWGREKDKGMPDYVFQNKVMIFLLEKYILMAKTGH